MSTTTVETRVLIAYHGDAALKESRLTRVRAHRLADQIVKGQYWEEGKGCAVGCTIHGSDHARYESELGIPIMLARLEDRIFEGLPNSVAMGWPERFLAAIQPGADLSLVGWQFLSWLIDDVLDRYGNDAVREACGDAQSVLRSKSAGEPVDRNTALSAGQKARAAAYAADAAYAAAAAYAAYAATYAAYAAAYAADAAAAAAYAADAADAARQNYYVQMAERLESLLAAAPVGRGPS